MKGNNERNDYVETSTSHVNAQQAPVDAHQSICQLLEIDEVNLDMTKAMGDCYLHTRSKANVVVVGGHKTQLT